MNAVARYTCRMLATGFTLTYPIQSFAHKRSWKLTGAGLIGTLWGIPCAYYLPKDPVRCLLALLGVILVSVVISEVAEEDLGIPDDPRIVIDEWAGYLTSVALLPNTPAYLVSGFVLFRLFDTWKPLGLRRLGNLPGGWGIVLDDIGAGILVNLILHLVYRFA